MDIKTCQREKKQKGYIIFENEFRVTQSLLRHLLMSREQLTTCPRRTRELISLTEQLPLMESKGSPDFLRRQATGPYPKTMRFTFYKLARHANLSSIAAPRFSRYVLHVP
jgi:hypothetical protein